ncbi:SDR family NAD(P)-dependent oxidoreductase [Marisediminicola sp. LYQ134]|uniref:SDR family NAD(P)-dependent oxidoreductase n=1 Tax=unclassified Marisediminicola TaxID=2618316 RepID=UPI003983B6A4
MTTPPVTSTSARLAGARAVVTGGARGIGAHIAERLSADGADVAILDRLTERGEPTAERIGGRFIDVDLLHPLSTIAAMKTAIAHLGGIDILVNNAGILRLTPLLDISVEEWDHVFDINTRPMLVTTQIAARSMISAGTAGTIINIASMAGKSGGAGQAHYAASKAAVIALTRVSALELGEHDITVNCVCPGYILTEMGAATRTDADVERWSSFSPLGRLGTPADVSGVVAFLASSDSDYLTGHAIDVSGGMAAQ